MPGGGGACTTRPGAAPYWFTADIDADPFETVIIIGTRVRVRERASLAAATLTVLSHTAVLATPRGAAPEGWVAVRLQDGRDGFVAAPYARSAVGYRLGIQRLGERWQIIFFLAGD